MKFEAQIDLFCKHNCSLLSKNLERERKYLCTNLKMSANNVYLKIYDRYRSLTFTRLVRGEAKYDSYQILHTIRCDVLQPWIRLNVTKWLIISDPYYSRISYSTYGHISYRKAYHRWIMLLNNRIFMCRAQTNLGAIAGSDT